MNNLQKILIIVISTFVFTGCFAAQRNAVYKQANDERRVLDAQCKSPMTDWCMEQYQQISILEQSELNDISNRQAQAAENARAAGQAISAGGQAFQNSLNNNRQVNCTSTTIGSQTYTNCH